MYTAEFIQSRASNSSLC